MMKVELQPAYVWCCDTCGRENFQRSIARFLDPEDPNEARVIREAHRIPDELPIPDTKVCRVQTMPHGVVCSHCSSEFGTLEYLPGWLEELE